MFTRNDARWLSDTLGALYRAQTVEAFNSAAMIALDERFKLHSFACEELGMGGSSYRAHRLRCANPPPANYASHLHDNPFSWALGSERLPPVLHMRREVPFSNWCRTDHFNGIARPMGWHDQIMIVAQCRPTFVSVGLHRDTVFTAHENALTCLLHPHVSAAWVRVRSHSEVAERETSLRLHLSAQLQPIQLSPAQARLLRAYFPRSRSSTELPDALRTWVRDSLEKLRTQPPPHPLYAYKIESAHGRLLVRCFPATGGEASLHLVEIPSEPNFTRLRAHGLTTCECEVLHWIAQGKRDSEIATIVGSAVKTVSKHVEHLLAKLHVETRATATRTALEWLRRSR